ncbi:MAG: tRNA epoxyqueuosine(34) reductase QueG [Deinococcales bacterium]|nr:tRNA epoxyqueuosine(34) reductase QueG [Chitinophagaceae bacterium]
MNIKNHTQFIKQTATQLGFNYCGIAKAQFLTEDAYRLENWLQQGLNGTMQYMENHFDLRVDPTRLVPGAKSVITLLKNYYPQAQQNSDAAKVSKYAFGKDYHEVIKEQLKEFLYRINQSIGSINGRGFIDSAPVLERTWAVKSGLGWVGKNGNLINKNQGSFFFIATLIVDIDLQYDIPYLKDFCGTCTRCIDACPTEAILPDKVVDGSKCISYFTIELKELLIPNTMQGKFDDWLFGCDTCQDVCPWNRFSKPHQEQQFTPLNEVLNFTIKDWEMLTEESFNTIFKKSPIKRTKYKGIQRNLQFLKG